MARQEEKPIPIKPMAQAYYGELDVLQKILAELRAIRTAIEHPKETALKEIRETVTT